MQRHPGRAMCNQGVCNQLKGVRAAQGGSLSQGLRTTQFRVGRQEKGPGACR